MLKNCLLTSVKIFQRTSRIGVGLAGWPTASPARHLAGFLSAWLAGWRACWLTACLLTGVVAGWLAGWLAGMAVWGAPERFERL